MTIIEAYKCDECGKRFFDKPPKFRKEYFDDAYDVVVVGIYDFCSIKCKKEFLKKGGLK